MSNKTEIIMHPVRMKICQALMRNKEHGLTPLEMIKLIKDVPQATLYRHIQIMVDSDIIRVIKEKKVKSVSEKYYVLNVEEARLDEDEWKEATIEEKLNYISSYQLLLMTQYQNYLNNLEEQNRQEDRATFSVVELKINDEHFLQFQNELHELMTRYYNATSKEIDSPVRTIAITIIPET
ncbi:helix-turn-helix domain-containing protein [Gottfriedia acidiceleris]|uniref:helix-turn-helix domain-containing protein n=1 Tax=Bacillaceae TaxID=186817 RepID=UPI000BEDA197|nr:MULTISPECIES: helix-turn-helix domain-containing protein [unclassified Bacillus (in: firmicutes)]PEC51313.1 transcriptional regulator [Bacillus sp. AFS096315]PFM83357.1 transcriptional regulator [Bacillus sp. AFS077874]